MLYWGYVPKVKDWGNVFQISSFGVNHYKANFTALNSTQSHLYNSARNVAPIFSPTCGLVFDVPEETLESWRMGKSQLSHDACNNLTVAVYFYSMRCKQMQASFFTRDSLTPAYYVFVQSNWISSFFVDENASLMSWCSDAGEGEIIIE